MSKGQKNGNREVKKPKADKNRPKGLGSAYKQSLNKGAEAKNPFAKKT